MIMQTHQHISFNSLRDCPTYNPIKFINAISRIMEVKNDAALARALGYHPAVICKLRKRSFGISAENILRIHEVTGIPVKELREMMGAPAFILPVNNKGAKK